MNPVVVIFGANGFLGRYMSRHFARQGREVVAVGRHKDGWSGDGMFLDWDGKTPGPWTLALEGAEAVINLAGCSVNCRYTPENRRQIRESRVDATRAIGRAIAGAAAERVGPLPAVTDFAGRHGLGVRGTVGGRTVLVGRPALLTDEGLTVDAALAGRMTAAEAAGRTAVMVGWDGRARGVLAVADRVKPTSRPAIDALRRLGLTPVLLTGDNATVARAVAAEVGVDEVIAGVLPAEKVDAVKRLQADGRVVAMVGDGVNDAAALAQADLGLAMGTGTDAAIEAADLTLVRGDLTAAVDAVRLSRRTLRTIQGNLFWAFAYNVAALPLAAAGLLNPMIAGAAMAMSSAFVVANSLRLRRFRPVVLSR